MQLNGIEFSEEPKKLSAYYSAPSQNIAVLERKLLHQGFEILAVTSIFPDSSVITITNEELKNTNSYMATLQISVNTEDVRVQNPSYLGAAYLGEKYYYGMFYDTITALENVLGTLHSSAEKLNVKELGNYCFMYGLPKKDDILNIKADANLLNKISTKEAKRHITYQLKLPNGTTLIGHKLNHKTNEFLNVLGEHRSSHVLPYEAMIKDNVVSIMNPKYYLALSFPELTLEQFIQIASTPDQIYRNIKKVYQ
ncbi:MAG TPA: hypothetical protein ENK95_02345 [Campylobacterales bacterium]|nr:hypothetical protein [Campylobacterales bacterium]